jgi:hypothetical protein
MPRSGSAQPTQQLLPLCPNARRPLLCPSGLARGPARAPPSWNPWDQRTGAFTKRSVSPSLVGAVASARVAASRVRPSSSPW